MLAIAYAGALILGLLLVVMLPVWMYSRGKKNNDGGKYGSMSLALGGVLFFAYMIFIAYLESGPFNTAHSGYEGVQSGFISLVGIFAMIVGLLWRVVAGFKKS